MSNSNETFVPAANPTTDNDFIESLDSLTIDDVVPPHRKKPLKENVSASKIIRLAVVFLCLAVFLYCISELTTIVKNYKKTDELYDSFGFSHWQATTSSTGSNVSKLLLQLSDMPMMNNADVILNGPPTYLPPDNLHGAITTDPIFQMRLSHIQKLRDINSDIYGAILISDTKIDYPMVQCDNNDYYLTHSFDKGPLPAGSIFIDCRNDRNIERNSNIVIYGHNMVNGSMFADVTNYVLDKDFFMDDAHDVQITTFDGLYTFRVFSAYPTVSNDPYFRTHFANDSDFLAFCEEREKKSLYHKEGIEFKPDDVVITFSTCILGQDKGRYAVHAVLVDIKR